MIQPEEIREKAANLYPAMLDAWLRGDLFFPRRIRANTTLQGDLATAIASVQRLRAGSKEVVGFGYAVEWVEVNSPKYGRNSFPERIVFETQDDFLTYIGKQREFASFTTAVESIRSRHRRLEPWIQSNKAALISISSEIDHLLHVVDYLVAHPRPGIYAREIPGPMDTKCIERNRRVLREWLDRLLPSDTIRADEEHFERRYGLRYAEPHILVRWLDHDAQRRCEWTWPELSLPLHTLAATAMNHVRRVFVVENKVSLLTLPQVPDSIAIGGLGNGVTDLRYLKWLSGCELWYWGDLDTDGFAILSRLRSLLPHTRSLMMDDLTLRRWRELAVRGAGRTDGRFPGLTSNEKAALDTCTSENLRIEQERLPQVFVNAALETAVATRINRVEPVTNAEQPLRFIPSRL
jgi:hypothetical protein